MGALIGLLRMAVPFAATIFGGYFVSDVFNERMAAKQAQGKVDYPAIIGKTIKEQADKWKFVAIAGLVFGVVSGLIIKKLGK